MRKSQLDQLREHFKTYPSISPLEASSLYRIRSLSSRINELQRKGWWFKHDVRRDPEGQRYVRYILEAQGT